VRSLRPAAALLLLLAAACATTPTAPSAELRADGRPVLFIGNSHTYVNDVPGIVQALADSAGGERLAVATVAFPDYALEDHWANGAARAALAARSWSVVVLQQGPSSQDDSRSNLRAWAQRFAPEIRKAGARPALYGVWPSVVRQQDFDRATESYALAAADVDGLHFPAGEAWRAAWRQAPDAALYAGDGLHASAAAYEPAALVIWAGLTGRSPEGLPARVRTAGGAVVGVSAALAPVLQRAAAEALAKFGRK
jgi:hypothetical protein